MASHDRNVPRRSFLSRFGTALTAVGAAVAATGTRARAQTASAAWQPARHAQDDWLGQIPGAHRFLFDSTSPDGFGSALQFASNFFIANQSGYGLKDSDLAVVIVARHHSTQYAYNKSIWTKYRGELLKAADVEALPDFTERLDGLLQRGVHLAVCQMATRRIAGTIAKLRGATPEAVYDELAANLVPNAQLVPAGIVAVNRAQERGFSFAQGA